VEKVCCYFDGRVGLWSELEVLEEEGCSMFVPEELLVEVEVPSVHSLVENKIAWHSTHPLPGVNSDTSHHPPCKAKPKGCC
jgi:hypothetical protein